MTRFATFLFAAFLLLNSAAFAQGGSITGKVTDAQTGRALAGATVMLSGTSFGDYTDEYGKFEIKNIPDGDYTLRVTYLSYLESVESVSVQGGKSVTLNVDMEPTVIESEAISVVSSRAISRVTPVAFSDLTKREIEMKSSSEDITMIAMETPSVYASMQGGAAGDSRINIRGFDQRNIAVMINGVPVNDMENGWVYWSNWAGLKEVISSQQIQRGLGASLLANPSVGGTMNMITDAAKLKPGINFQQYIGHDAYLKTALTANTGKIGDLAVSVSAVKTSGDGIVDMAWEDAWSYYLGLSYDVTKKHQLDFYVIGAPQQHGQRTYTQPISYWSKELAEQYRLDQNLIDGAADRGYLFNPHWGYVKNHDIGKVYYNGSEHDYRFDDKLMERENFYHKPQMNLNWFWEINEQTSLTNVFYLSIGQGGGSGRLGPGFDYTDDGLIDFDAQFEENMNNIDADWSATENRSSTILRNSVNQHFWYGWLGTLNFDLNDDMNLKTGLDIRNYKGEHWREVRSLLGGDYYVHTLRGPNGYTDSTNNYNILDDRDAWVKRLGDKVDYHNDGLVQWFGGFAQLEYTVTDDITVYGMGSVSNTGYKRIDYFKLPEDEETDWERILGYTIKGGANYNLNSRENIYANVGYYDRPPIFDAVYDYDNTKYDPIYNEKVFGFEAGYGYAAYKFRADAAFYYTKWMDRTVPEHTYNQEQDVTYHYLIRGIDARHMGVELEASYKPVRFLSFKTAVSIGDWEWQNDVIATYAIDDELDNVDTTEVYADGLKVGDAPQKQFYIGATVYPWRNSYINLNYIYFVDFYADYDPGGRSDPGDRRQPWRMPNYGLLNLHAGFTLPVDLPVDIQIGANATNLLDVMYLSDADDASPYGTDGSHTQNGASVYPGRPLTWSTFIRIMW